MTQPHMVCHDMNQKSTWICFTEGPRGLHLENKGEGVQQAFWNPDPISVKNITWDFLHPISDRNCFFFKKNSKVNIQHT